MNKKQRLTKLNHPSARVNAVIDTDTYNEIDDQFAIVHALLSPEKLNIQAIHAAPFLNHRSTSAGEGMEKSYDEILRILERMDVSAQGFVYKGSGTFLTSETRAVESDAAYDLIRRAKEATQPLYVIALAALSNIASALLIEPSIIEKIVVVWLGGNAHYWEHNKEFNLKQERAATRVVFESGVPLVQIPCMGVTSHLRTTVAELERYIPKDNEVGQFLLERFKEYNDNHRGWSKEIWDLAPGAWLLNETWVPSIITKTPTLADDLMYTRNPKDHDMRLATFINRDAIFRDLFTKLGAN